MRWVGLGPQPKYYYGWVIVAVLSLVGGWTLSMGGSNVGFFIEPMRDELSFNRAVFGWASTARLVLGASSGMVIGRVLDRFGPRVLLAATGGLAGQLVIATGRINSEWQLVGLFAVLGLLGMQGTATIYTSPTVAKWFVRNRPRAMGMLFLGTPITLTLSFPLTQWLISEVGWRDAWLVLGGIGIAIMVPLSLVFLRRQPEDLGLLPDGDAPDETGASRSGSQEYPWTRAEALRTGAFWRLTAVFATQMFAAGSLSVFRFPHMIGNGITPAVVSYAASAEGAIAIVPALGLGIIVTRFGLPRVAVVSYLLFAFGIAFITIASNPVMAFIATMTWGVGISMVAMLQNTYYPNFFGRRHIGAIRGASLSVAMVAGAAAGPLTGYIGDRTGGFELVWWPVVVAVALSGLLLATATAPRAPITVPESAPDPGNA